MIPLFGVSVGISHTFMVAVIHRFLLTEPIVKLRPLSFHQYDMCQRHFQQSAVLKTRLTLVSYSPQFSLWLASIEKFGLLTVTEPGETIETDLTILCLGGESKVGRGFILCCATTKCAI